MIKFYGTQSREALQVVITHYARENLIYREAEIKV
jgi:hypothetical protein